MIEKVETQIFLEYRLPNPSWEDKRTYLKVEKVNTANPYVKEENDSNKTIAFILCLSPNTFKNKDTYYLPEKSDMKKMYVLLEKHKINNKFEEDLDSYLKANPKLLKYYEAAEQRDILPNCPSVYKNTVITDKAWTYILFFFGLAMNVMSRGR